MLLLLSCFACALLCYVTLRLHEKRERWQQVQEGVEPCDRVASPYRGTDATVPTFATNAPADVRLAAAMWSAGAALAARDSQAADKLRLASSVAFGVNTALIALTVGAVSDDGGFFLEGLGKYIAGFVIYCVSAIAHASFLRAVLRRYRAALAAA
jgi:hypothetical protein